MSNRVTIVVPLTPPSVNHYKEPITFRGHISFKESLSAKAFKHAVAILARGLSVDPVNEAARRKVKYRLRVVVYLGEKQRGDGDNFWKCTADALVDAGVIHSDAAVVDWILYKRRDVLRPRTEITARAFY
jgi:Holliday junction resolvase RusA-like endonuclease